MKLETLVQNELAIAKITKIELKNNHQFLWDLDEAVEEATKHLKKYHEKRNELLKEHGEETKEKPGSYYLKPDQVKPFNEAVEKLVKVDVKVKFPSIKLSEMSGIEMSMEIMRGLKALNIVKIK